MKQFDEWNDIKKGLESKEVTVLFKESELWWVSIGQNIGDETYGKGAQFRRPIVVLRKLSGTACIAIPLTSKEKEGTWYFSFTVDVICRDVR
jgi:hypothetical protein